MERTNIYQTQRAKDFRAKYAQYWDVPLMSDEQFRELLHRAQKEDAEGLIIAIRQYDRSSRFKFIPYAVWLVRRGILQAIEDKFKS